MENYSYSTQKYHKLMSFGGLRYKSAYVLIGLALLVGGIVAYQRLYVTQFSRTTQEAKYLAAANADPVTLSERVPDR